MAIYSPDVFEPFSARYNHKQRVNGGKVRASKAKRHEYGFFLPDKVDTVSLPENYVHGRAGALARWKKYHEQKEKEQIK